MIYLVCGPPCAGKTTLTLRVGKPEDQVLDFDAICAELDGQSGWIHAKHVRERAGQILDRRIRALHGPQLGNAYMIRSVPDALERTQLAQSLRAEVWLLDPGQGECVRRARAAGRPQRTLHTIANWYRTFRPAQVDRRPPRMI